MAGILRTYHIKLFYLPFCTWEVLTFLTYFRLRLLRIIRVQTDYNNIRLLGWDKL